MQRRASLTAASALVAERHLRERVSGARRIEDGDGGFIALTVVVEHTGHKPHASFSARAAAARPVAAQSRASLASFFFTFFRATSS